MCVSGHMGPVADGSYHVPTQDGGINLMYAEHAVYLLLFLCQYSAPVKNADSLTVDERLSDEEDEYLL